MSSDQKLAAFLLSRTAQSSQETESTIIPSNRLSSSIAILQSGDRHELERFVAANEPFLMIDDQVIGGWRSLQDWVAKENGKPAFDFLRSTFGLAEVDVADCEERHYNSQRKAQMRLKDYIDYWTELIANDYDYAKHKCLYLKDWHFTRDYPAYEAYKIHSCFQSDWLNEFWEARKDSEDDYRFVYMGPKGSWTPLHTDVFSSFSWSANVCGVKRWVMFPPEEDINLRDVRGNLPYDVTAPQMTDTALYPRFSHVKHRVEIRQGPGQIIFVPSKWLHQVFNEDDTISINHNWFNGCNIHVVWESLVAVHVDVQKEINDCRDMDGWHRQCQIILKATHGMDFDEFLYLLLTIAERRVLNLRDDVAVELSSSSVQATEDNVEWAGKTVDEIIIGLQTLGTVAPTLDVTMACRIAQSLFDLSKIQLTLSKVLSQHANNWDEVFEFPRELIERLQRAIKEFLGIFAPVCSKLVI